MFKDRGFPEIGKRLLAVRGEMDQRGFSRRLDLSQQAVSNYERGKLPNSWAFLRHLHDDFGVSLDWLITGAGQRDQRAGSARVALMDDRAPGWARTFVEHVAVQESDRLELLLHLYFLYLATEPADAKARVAADLQAVVEAARGRALDAERAGDDPADAEPPQALREVYGALARDDRRAAVRALVRLGDLIAGGHARGSLSHACRLYLAALGIARMQGWAEEELDAAARLGRTCGMLGRWAEADRHYRSAIEGFERGGAVSAGGATVPSGTDAASTASGRAGTEAPPVEVSQAIAAGRARTLLDRGRLAREQGDLAGARERCLAALSWAVRTPDAGLRAEVYLDLARIAHREQELRNALELVGSGKVFAQRAGDQRLLDGLELTEARVLRNEGEIETAEAILRALHGRGSEQRDPGAAVLASLELAEVLVDRGALAEAEELLRSAEALTKNDGDRRNRVLCKLLRARIAIAHGDGGTARAQLVDCLRDAASDDLAVEFERAAAALGRGTGGSGPAPESNAG